MGTKSWNSGNRDSSIHWRYLALAPVPELILRGELLQ